MKRTQNQNKRIYRLLNDLNISTDDKKNMVLSITKSRTEHTSEMYYAEAQRLIEKLEEMTEQTGKQDKQQNELKQRFRRSVFVLMYEIGLINSQMTSGEKVREINAFIQRKTKFQKHLNSFTVDELTTLLNQLQAIRRRYQEADGFNAKLN
ncbi:MAG: hypothetical protein K9I74_07910 [Bacteroidales bacterium]|nr:hypothetical protein [Bacteroidales bacterium]